jgi:hypothetical protein
LHISNQIQAFSKAKGLQEKLNELGLGEMRVYSGIQGREARKKIW